MNANIKSTKGKKVLGFAVISILAIIGAMYAIQMNKAKSENTDTNKAPISGETQGMIQNQKGDKKGFDPNNIDYASIAQKLNLTEDAVKAALTVETGQRLDIENAATTLGVSTDALREAMGIPDMPEKPAQGENNKNAPTPKPVDAKSN